MKLISLFVARGVGSAGIIFITLLIPLIEDTKTSAEFYLGITLLYLLGIVSRLGLDLVILKKSAVIFYANKKNFDKIDLILVVKPFLVAIAISILLYIGGYYYALLKQVRWIVLVLPAFSSIGVISLFLRGAGNEVWSCFLDLGSVSLLASLITILFLFSNLSPNIFYVYIISTWCVFVISLIFIYRNYKFNRNTSNQDHTSKQHYFFIMSISNYLIQWFPAFLFSLSSPKLVVYFTLANRFASILAFIGRTLDSFASPRFANLWERADIIKLGAFKKRIDSISLYLGFGGGVFVMLVATYYGKYQNYESSYFWILGILIIGFSVSIALGPNGFLLSMTGHERFAAFTTLLLFLLCLGLTSLLFLQSQYLLMVSVIALILIVKSIIYKYRAMRLLDNQ